MKKYRFTLEPYKGISTRYKCPRCHKNKAFVRYIDLDNEYKFPEYVGKCNRENKCQYHYTPKDYFKDSNVLLSYQSSTNFVREECKVNEYSTIDAKIVSRTIKSYSSNNLFLFLSKLIGESKTEILFNRYNVGTANCWNGATIFWQIDFESKARTGKVMLYNKETGKRVKYPHSYINWVHTILKQKNFKLEQCFFGEHLLKGNGQTIAIVESEKTALIASHFMPQFVWLASGGKHGCLKQRLHILKNRKVILFPDLNAYEEWKFIGKKFSNITVFDYLENNATTENKKEGLDIADYLTSKC